MIDLPDTRLEAQDPRIHWCLERMNYAEWDYSCYQPVRFWFYKEADAVLFALTWAEQKMKYHITVPKMVKYVTDVDPRVDWCYHNIKSKRSWKAVGWAPVTFSFTQEKDAVWFALIWSGKNEN
jgi:hypothetical protein